MADILTATLTRQQQVTPGTARLTFDVPGFASTGMADEWVHVFLGEPGDHKDRRNYTIRAVRGQEVDVDVVLHGQGMMVDWVRGAEPGDALPWGEVTGSHEPPADTDWHLVVADITGLPAVARILAELPAGVRAHVVLETYDEADRQELPTEADAEIVWLHGTGEGRSASRLEAAVRTFPEPAGKGYRWMAGETRVVRGARKHLRRERRVEKAEWSLTGYWLQDAEAWEKRYHEHADELEGIWTRGEEEGRDTEEIMDDYDAALERVGL